MLVVCEGARTEPDYFRGLERAVRNARVEVQYARERGEPRKVVEIARRLYEQAEEGDFDEVWCVYDRDEHPHFAEATQTARQLGFLLAISNPCFELWLVLHFRESLGERHRADVCRTVKQFVPDYDKLIDFAAYETGVEGAMRRAERLETDAEAMEEAGRNPTTGVWRLVGSIRRQE